CYQSPPVLSPLLSSPVFSSRLLSPSLHLMSGHLFPSKKDPWRLTSGFFFKHKRPPVVPGQSASPPATCCFRLILHSSGMSSAPADASPPRDPQNIPVPVQTLKAVCVCG
ncbi:hypothetical protein JZ751_025620, partial [Albula glossodonta]